MKTLSEQINIRIIEVYYKKEFPLYNELEKVRSFCPVYFCWYDENPKKRFVRIGLLNPSKKVLNQLVLFCKKKGTVKQWVEVGEPHMELMKFMAFDTAKLINDTVSSNKDIYNRMSNRKYLPNGLPRSNPYFLSYDDYTQWLHHTFNMLGMGYNQEVFIYSFAATALDASHKYHIDEHLFKRKAR